MSKNEQHGQNKINAKNYMQFLHSVKGQWIKSTKYDVMTVAAVNVNHEVFRYFWVS